MSRGKVFLSYRRADNAAMAECLYDRLKDLFPGRIFLDVEDIQPGADFLARINENLESCRLLVILIGKHWGRILFVKPDTVAFATMKKQGIGMPS